MTDQTRVIQKHGKIVKRIQTLVQKILEADDRTMELRVYKTTHDHMRVASDASLPNDIADLPDSIRDELIDYRIAALKAEVKRMKRDLGDEILDAMRYGVDVIKFDVDLDFVFPTARHEAEKRRAGDTATLPQAQMINILREMHGKTLGNHLLAVKKYGAKAHNTLRLEGAHNALDALIVWYESEGLL